MSGDLCVFGLLGVLLLVCGCGWMFVAKYESVCVEGDVYVNGCA